MLFDDEDGEPVQLQVNSGFAKKFEERKKREERSKLTSKLGNDLAALEEEEESSSESEDDEAEEITPNLERDFLRTLAALKGNDERVLKSDVKFFADPPSDDGEGEAKPKKDKPMYLHDHERRRILTKGTKAFVSDDDDSDAEQDDASKPAPGSLADEQLKSKQALIRALNDAEAVGNDAEEEDFFAKKTKSATEREQEEADYQRWLQEEGAHVFDEETAQELQPLKRFWTDPNLSEDDKFLRDYITKRLWRGDDFSAGPNAAAPVSDSEDEEELEKMEEFERKFNFRYEEADGAEIVHYPRTIDESVRKKSTKRKDARERRKERKEQEKLQRAEEIKRLKNLKQQEIQAQLDQIKEIAGGVEGVEALDLDGQFDPEKFDQQLQQIFNDEYYEKGDDDEKPEFDDLSDREYDREDDEEGEAGEAGGVGDEEYFDEEYGEGGEEEYGDGDGYGEDYGEYTGDFIEDPDFVMDADYIDEQEAAAEANAKGKKAKKKSQLSEGEKDQLEKTKQNIEKSLDELYKMDYEDVVGGVPTRFKYRQVVPNDFGLTIEEILTADERELNQWVSLKKMSKYRKEEEELRDVRHFKKRAKDAARKRRILASIYAQQEPAEERSSAKPGKKEKHGGRKDGHKHGKDGARKDHKDASRKRRADGDGEHRHKSKKLRGDGSQKPAAAAAAAAAAAGDKKRKKARGSDQQSPRKSGSSVKSVSDIPSARLAAYKALVK